MTSSGTPVKLGLFSANVSERSTGSEAVATARLAEHLGLESLWTGEHIVIPAHFDTRYPYDPSGEMPGADRVDMPDPLIWLAYVAAATSTIKLATGVTVLPLRHPMVAAKQIATLDALSGGRVILGIGVGWLQEEFAALEIPFHDRGRRTDDYLEAMKALWTQREASISNQFVTFTSATSRPRPRAPIPIVVAGSSTAAVRRTARVGDGWFPGAASAEELQPWLGRLADECRAVGRHPSEIELTVYDRNTDPDALTVGIEEFIKAGVSRVLIPKVPADDLAHVVAILNDRLPIVAA